MTSNQIHTSLHVRRLNDGGPASGRELVFAGQQEQNHDLLAYLLGSDDQKVDFTDSGSDRVSANAILKRSKSV